MNTIDESIPDDFVRVKPNEVVVLDRYYPVNDFKANAFAVSEDNGFMFFDTKSYHTNGKVKIYGNN